MNRRTRCPHCGNNRSSRHGPAIRRALRWVSGRPAKRRCVSCGQRFTGVRASTPLRLLFFVGAMSLVTFLFMALISEASPPIAWTKEGVVKHYQGSFGNENKKKIWEHLGWIYSTKKKAREDYHGNDVRRK